MMTNQHASNKRQSDHGVSLLIIAASMIFILGMAGLGIDLASLYVARSQAQRAADAGALAGAQYLTMQGCATSPGGDISGDCQAVAIQRAEAVGNENLIAGITPNIGNLSTDVTFLSTNSGDPQIQVIAARDTAHGNPMPTFFMKIFGVNTANVSAKAVAEAYIGTGNGPPVGATCVKPWLIPNCDPGNTNSSEVNSNCSPTAGKFVDVTQGGIASSLLADRNTPYVQGGGGGVIGEPYTLKPGTPGGAAAPGQYYAAYLPITPNTPVACPACANATPPNGGVGSGAVYRENIECCNGNPIVCGSNNVTISSAQGTMVGPTSQGVQCLIRQGGRTFQSNCGQDKLNGINNPCSNPASPQLAASPFPPFKVISGPNSQFLPSGTEQNLTDSTSPSLVTLPIWDGTPLQPGQNINLNVVGFVQLFIQDVNNAQQGTVYGHIIRVISCGNSGGAGAGPGGGTVVGNGSPVVVRLIHE